MSNVYDNWERLVRAVLREDKLRRDALRDFSMLSLSSFSSSSSSLFQQEGYQQLGKTISRWRKNYDLMLNLQLGIRYSVGLLDLGSFKEDWSKDFDPKQNFWTRFPSEGSKITPPSRSGEFLWKNYCPRLFSNLRQVFKVDLADYMMAICGDDALREQSYPEKSGRFFYLTQDDRFMIKAVKESEFKVLIKMLPSYYHHVCQFENSLLTKFYGAYCIKQGGVKNWFVVMDNLFCSEYQIHRRFDLKGSLGRSFEGEIEETTTFKDLDLNFVFRLYSRWYKKLMKQIDLDCQFLEAQAIMDYSLLVGIHFCDNNTDGKIGSPPRLKTEQRDLCQHGTLLHGSTLVSKQQEMDGILGWWKPSMRLGFKMPAIAEQMAEMNEIYEVVLYFGIVGILQDYDISKKLEHAYKFLQFDSASISTADPKFYSERFREFMGKIFVEDKVMDTVEETSGY